MTVKEIGLASLRGGPFLLPNRKFRLPMEVRLSEADAKLYSKLYVSSDDIEFAKYCVGVLLKKGWHNQPWERRGTIYRQQSAFTSALVTAYARPFTHSKGWPNFPTGLIPYDTAENTLHKKLIDLRHTVYAHSDSISYSIRPWRSKDFSTDIVGAPVLRLTVEEATLFQSMTTKLLAAIYVKRTEIMDAVPL